MDQSKPKWKLFECPRGNRWTSVGFNYAGEVCTFSGCNCGGIVAIKGETQDRTAAAEWYRNMGGEIRLDPDWQARFMQSKSRTKIQDKHA